VRATSEWETAFCRVLSRHRPKRAPPNQDVRFFPRPIFVIAAFRRRGVQTPSKVPPLRPPGPGRVPCRPLPHAPERPASEAPRPELVKIAQIHIYLHALRQSTARRASAGYSSDSIFTTQKKIICVMGGGCGYINPSFPYNKYHPLIVSCPRQPIVVKP